MIKLLRIFEETDLLVTGHGTSVRAALVADTKAEISENSVIVGLPENTELMIGSTILTTNGEYAIRNSSGEWIWQDEDEEETAQTATVSPTVSPQTLSLGRNILNSIETNELSDYEEPVINEPYEEPEELTER